MKSLENWWNPLKQWFCFAISGKRWYPQWGHLLSSWKGRTFGILSSPKQVYRLWSRSAPYRIFGEWKTSVQNSGWPAQTLYGGMGRENFIFSQTTQGMIIITNNLAQIVKRARAQVIWVWVWCSLPLVNPAFMLS